MITLTGSVMDFAFDNPVAGWILLGLSAIILAIAYIAYRKEHKRP